MMDPFKPKEVKLYNYDSNRIENNKLDNVRQKTLEANGRQSEYQRDYQEKSYKDVIKRPQSYGDVMKRPQSYGDARVSNSIEDNRNQNTIPDFDKVSNIKRVNMYENQNH